jgi:hypothetical protein
VQYHCYAYKSKTVIYSVRHRFTYLDYFDYSFTYINNLLFQGSDPRVATCRGKLQNKRSKLNQEINKELRLRAGAENLFK